MRISDWSSDVCSSDLSALRKIGAVPVLGLTAAKSSAPSSITRVARRRSLAPASSGSTGGASSATACRKNAQRADLKRRDGPPNTSAQNLKLAWMSRSEEHTSELQSLMRISYDVFCLTKKKH